MTAAVAVAGIAGLVAAGAGTAAGAPHAHTLASVHISTPKLVITGTTTGSGDNAHSMLTSIKGPRKFSAGRVDLKLKAVGGEQEIEIVRLKPGYTFADVNRDFGAFGAYEGGAPGASKQAALKGLRRVVRNVKFYGGLDTGSLRSVQGSVVLNKPGKYYIVNDENQGPAQPHKIVVTAKVGTRSVPVSTATVKATTAKRFIGAKVLPHKGTITFKNRSTNSPHFLVLQHVKKGTTRRQVIAYVNSNSQAPPPWGLKDNVATDVVGEGKSQTLTYDLPRGTYVEMCFFPDLQGSLMPHAAMGMDRIVKLK
jgi:hypothetical protein